MAIEMDHIILGDIMICTYSNDGYDNVDPKKFHPKNFITHNFLLTFCVLSQQTCFPIRYFQWDQFSVTSKSTKTSKRSRRRSYHETCCILVSVDSIVHNITYQINIAESRIAKSIYPYLAFFNFHLTLLPKLKFKQLKESLLA